MNFTTDQPNVIRMFKYSGEQELEIKDFTRDQLMEQLRSLPPHYSTSIVITERNSKVFLERASYIKHHRQVQIVERKAGTNGNMQGRGRRRATISPNTVTLKLGQPKPATATETKTTKEH